MKRVKQLALMLLASLLAPCVWAAADENGKLPDAWLRFDGNWDWTANTGVLSWEDGERNNSFVKSPAGKAMKTVNNATHPYGAVSNLGSTWTISTTIKAAVPSDGKFEPVYHFGGKANGWGIGVRKVEGNANACEVVFGKAPFSANSLLISKTIDDGCSAYHTYTVTFANNTLTMYVDGETAEGDSKTGVTLTTGRDNYQFGGVHGGHNTTYQNRISNLEMDDFRVYKSVLTAAEIAKIGTGKYAVNDSGVITEATGGVVPVDITVDTKTIQTSGDATLLQTVSGKAAKYDWTYNSVSLQSVGTDTASMDRDTTQGFNGALANCFKYAEDDNTKVTALYTGTLAYQDMSIPANFSAAISCTIPPLENGIVMAFGSNNNNNGVIAIAAGAPTTNEDGSTTENMKLVYIPRNATAAQVKTLATMAVPNGRTAAHLLVFTKQGSAMKIYMDGKLATTASLDVSPSGGFQMGSVHGGTYGGYKSSGRSNLSGDALYTSYIKTIRVFDCILSETAMAELVKEFPYTSPSGSSAIEVADTADWVSSSGTPWTITAQDGSTSESATAKPGSSVTVTATADAAMTVAVSVDVAYEALTIDGTGTIKFVKGEGEGQLKPTNTTIKTPITIGEGTIDLTGGAVTLEGNGSITFDFTSLTAVTRAMEHLDLPVTGVMVRDDSKVSILKAENVTVEDGCVFELRYNEANQCYHVYAGKINADGKLYWNAAQGNSWNDGAKANAHDKDGNDVLVTIHDDDTVVFDGTTFTDVLYIGATKATKIEVTAGTLKIGHNGTAGMNLPSGSTVTIAEGAKVGLQCWDNTINATTNSVNLPDVAFNGGTVEIHSSITEVNVSGDVTGTAKIVIPANAVTTVAANKYIGTTVGGEGTIKMSTMHSLTMAEDWTGTVDLGSISLANDTWYNSVGHAGSTVKFDSFSGHLPANNSVVAPTLEFGSMTITGGYNGHTGTYNKIKGNGSFSNSLSLPNQGLYTIKIGDVSEFTGTLTIGNDGALELPNDAEVTVAGATAKVVGETTTIYYPSNADALSGKTPSDNVSNVTILSGSLPAAWDGYKVDADGNIVVMDNYTITVVANEYATVSEIPSSVREDAAAITFTVTPVESHNLTAVKANDTVLEADANGVYTIKIDADTEITVETAIKTYTVTLKTFDHTTCYAKIGTDGEEFAYNEPITVNHGGAVYFRYVADENYKIEGNANLQFTGIKSDIGTNLTYTITVVLDVTTITIPPVANMTAAVVDAEGQAIVISDSNTITVTIGSTFTVKYTPVAGFVGETITLDVITAAVDTVVTAPTTGLPVAAVAKIGDKLVSAADFRTSVNAIAGEETVQLLADINLGTTYVTIKAGAAVTLDLNGKKLTSSGSYAVSLTGSLTVKDSATGGKIANTKASSGKTIYGSKGTFALESGTIEATAAAVSVGTVNISGGTITAGTGNAVSGSGTISGGTITSTSLYAAYADQSGKALVITDGTLKGAAAKGDVGIYTGNVKVTGIEGVKIAFASNASGLVLADTDAALIPAVADVAVYDGETLEGYYFSASSNGLYTGCKGKTCKLVKNIDHQIAIGVNTTLDLNDYNITVTDAISAILVKSGTSTAVRTVTITGEGTVSCDNGSGCNAVQVQRYADVTIAGGSYYVGADTASSDPDNATIYIVDSYKIAPTKVTITGGTFEAAGSGDFTLNILDSLMTAEAVPTITVSGGTFKGFDPSNCVSEGAGTNFVAEGYESVEGNDGCFYVQVKTDKPVVPEVEATDEAITPTVPQGGSVEVITPNGTTLTGENAKIDLETVETAAIFTVVTTNAEGVKTVANVGVVNAKDAEAGEAPAKTTTAVAVPFEGATVANLLNTALLAKGDTLQAYIGGKYEMWTLGEDKTWSYTKIARVGGEEGEALPASTTLARGTAVWVMTAGKIVVLGKYNESATIVEPTEGETNLLANPKMEAYTPEVKADDAQDQVVEIGTKAPVRYTKKGGKWTKKAKIYDPDWDMYIDGDEDAAPVIPVGKGFWFIKK